jgi:S1-C subfamily serine protease/rhodanese-related sulfurtransferase
MLRRIARVVSGLLGLSAALVSPAAAQPMFSVQEIVLRVKPAVVLISAEVSAEVTLDCGNGVQTVAPPTFRETGTGWFVDSRGWVITNGHVVEPAHSPPPWLVNQQAQRAVATACLPKVLAQRGINPGERPDVEDAIKRKLLDAVLPTTKVKLNPQLTVVISSGVRHKAEVIKYTPPISKEPGVMSGRDLALLRIPGQGFPVIPLMEGRSVQIGDPLHILGFPGVVLTHELLNKSASLDASVNNGAVSGLKEDVSNQPVIQTDAPASWGNSGGPAVNQRGQVVGVLTFVSLAPGPEGALVQGFNFVIPAEAVRDFVKGTDVRLDGASKFNEEWYAGLRDFSAEDYKSAVRHFEKADALVPNLPDVKRRLSETREFVKNPPPRPFPWFWVAVGVTLVSAAGYGAQFLLRWQKNRHRVQPSEVVKLLESGKQPQVLDVRTPEAYDTLPLRIPGSIRLPPEELASGVSGLELDPGRPVIAYCTSPNEQTSARVARELRKLGFKNALILKGGLGAWTNAGLPIETRSDISAVGLELYKALAGGGTS